MTNHFAPASKAVTNLAVRSHAHGTTNYQVSVALAINAARVSLCDQAPLADALSEFGRAETRNPVIVLLRRARSIAFV